MSNPAPGVAIALFLLCSLSPASAFAADSPELSERLQRHHEAPAGRTQHAPQTSGSTRQDQPPAHAGETRRPERSHQSGHPGYSRQERSRDSRGNRPRHSNDRAEESFDPDSRWNVHDAPEPDSGEKDEDPDDGRIYFEHYP